jgi:hypothetical protein
MDIAWFRDLTIIICGVLAFIVLTMVLTLMIAYRRRFTEIINSLEVTAKNIEEISTSARKVIIAPLAVIGSVSQGLFNGINAISGIFRRK